MTARHAAHLATRRGFLRGAAGTTLGLAALAGGLPIRPLFADEIAAAAPASDPSGAATLEHLIVLWMAGGPSHLDTFDPKPGRKTGGPYKALPTAVDGLSFCEHLPKLAKEAKDLAVIRSLTSRQGAHERATHLYQTGYEPDATVAHPHLGAWIARARGEPTNDLPAFVAIGGNEGSGFLGPDLAPYQIADVNLPVQDLAPRGVSKERQTRRTAFLDALGGAFADRHGHDVAAAQRAARARARRMMASPAAKAFDPNQESKEKRAAYGNTFIGKACLLARRLVEADVRVVHVTMGGWDNHRDAFPAIQRLCQQLDPAYAELVKDLRERDLLAKTGVLWMGEFSRTPDINATKGRDHYPHAASAVLAGGGVPGGQIIGKTDDDGRKVVESPVAPADLTKTLLHLAGVPVDESRITPAGRPIWPAPKEAKLVPALLPTPAATTRAAT
jgi:uncharacterized protein (DUF1501 family)